MGRGQDISGPQFRGDRPQEQEAVRTTIVGGRPPGRGQSLGDVPRGVEILIKKASVDPQFKSLLLARRAEAARRIGLDLDPAEVLMLEAVPAEQLEAIIARTDVPAEHRRAFLGKAAGAMLAVVGLAAQGCGPGPATTGSRPDPVGPDPPDGTRGTRPDPPDGTRGTRPDLPEPQPPKDGEPTGAAPETGETSKATPTDQSEDKPSALETGKFEFGFGRDRLPPITGSRPDVPPGPSP